MSQTAPLRLHDLEPEAEQIRDEILAGLRRAQKTLPCKYLYDARGSALFEQICALEEYYPTRTELGIMDRYGDEMASVLGPRVLLIEYGSGSSTKTQLLLESLEDPVAYVPVDISREPLLRSAEHLDRRHPSLELLPICADFSEPFPLPEPIQSPKRRVVYFPGSTIGNFDPGEVVRFLARVTRQVGRGGGLLLGVDLRKQQSILEAAYDDRKGVTAAFNLNLLVRLNRELEADFDLTRFSHQAVYLTDLGRVEMRLVSKVDQTVSVAGERIAFCSGEWIHTESSYKFTLDGFAGLATRAGLAVSRVWLDEACLFSVQYLTPR